MCCFTTSLASALLGIDSQSLQSSTEGQTQFFQNILFGVLMMVVFKLSKVRHTSAATQGVGLGACLLMTHQTRHTKRGEMCRSQERIGINLLCGHIHVCHLAFMRAKTSTVRRPRQKSMGVAVLTRVTHHLTVLHLTCCSKISTGLTTNIRSFSYSTIQ